MDNKVVVSKKGERICHNHLLFRLPICPSHLHMFIHPEKSTVPMLQRRAQCYREGLELPGIWKTDSFDSVSLILDPSRKVRLKARLSEARGKQLKKLTMRESNARAVGAREPEPTIYVYFPGPVYREDRGNHLSWLWYSTNSITDRIKSLAIFFQIHCCLFYEHSIHHFLKLKTTRN